MPGKGYLSDNYQNLKMAIDSSRGGRRRLT
jgi:hypothetical protein